jgi:hypothetical protein
MNDKFRRKAIWVLREFARQGDVNYAEHPPAMRESTHGISMFRVKMREDR